MQSGAVLLGLGYVTSNWIGFGFSFYEGPVLAFRPILGMLACSESTFSLSQNGLNDFTWRFFSDSLPSALGIPAPVLFMVCSIWLPESPRWLIMKDRHEEAHALLKRLHRSPTDHDDSFADVQYYQISKQAEVDASLDLSYNAMVSNKPMLRRTIFGIVWPAMTATSGVNVIVSE
jgi:hypothetical protein